ncbi:hypothetical protein BG006_011502 [Podila minutissima]|uniref:Uncharacterized protein n=1 Tax=Podila minutissima TaxID=64525 RepID=A0A9P5VI22_9FUNG|nr:hypothetical protein BG006_011502 [Podila minutissima]
MGPLAEYPAQDGTFLHHPADHHSQSTFATDEESASSQQEPQEVAITGPSLAEASGHESLLSKETIAIFEFSRKFRQEKAEAARLEEAAIKKRKIKRRKLTRLGFAYDEGDSGLDDDNSVSDTDTKDGGSTGKIGREEDDHADDGADDGADEAPTSEELPATNVTFMALNDRLRSKTWQRLYGTVQEKEASLSKLSARFTTIDMLESLLNQQYENSLIADSETSGNRQRSQTSDQVVYWPGMPLRC